MKYWRFIGILGAAFSINADAGLSNPMEQADVPANHKFFNTSNVNLPAVPMKMWSGGNTLHSGKIVPDKFVPDKYAPTREVYMPAEATSTTLEKARTSGSVVRQANFTSRRAESNNRYYQTTSVKKEKASVNPREIKPLTPGGIDDLKKQLNSLQWTTAK